MPDDDPPCRARHFATQNAAFKYLERVHHGAGSARKCACGGGWRCTSAAEDAAARPAPPSDDERQDCFARTRYPTERIAKAAIRQHRTGQSAQACTVCGGWHARPPV